jgi:hypothetical protein
LSVFTNNTINLILQIRPRLVRYTPVGTRVCCYWSSQLSYLYPATVTALEPSQQLLTLQLDDGDERVVHVDSVRLLPADYPRVDAADPVGAVAVDSSTRTTLTVQVFVYTFLVCTARINIDFSYIKVGNMKPTCNVMVPVLITRYGTSTGYLSA